MTARAPLVVLAICLGGVACVPTISDLTRRYEPPSSLAERIDADEPAAVLPVWYDNGECTIRRPFRTTVGRLASGTSRPPARHRFGFFGLDGHGPSHFYSLSGLVVLAGSGRALWIRGDGIVGRDLACRERDRLLREVELGRRLASIASWPAATDRQSCGRLLGCSCVRETFELIGSREERTALAAFVRGMECIGAGDGDS